MDRNANIKNFETDLKKFDKTITLRLFLLLGISVIISYLYERSAIKSNPIDLALILYLVLSIVYSIIATIIGKKNICVKYNLKCPQCGKIPKAIFAVSAMRSGKCPGCGNRFGN
jgi:hypothetical protein